MNILCFSLQKFILSRQPIPPENFPWSLKPYWPKFCPRSLPTLHSIPQDYFPSTRQPFDLNILGHPPSIAKRPLFPTLVQGLQASHLLAFYAFVFMDVICSALRRFSPSRAETVDRDLNSLALGPDRHWSLFILTICQCVCFFPWLCCTYLVNKKQPLPKR